MSVLTRLTGIEKARLGERVAVLAAVAVGAMVTGGLTIAYLSVALYAALVPPWGPVGAALGVAGLSLVLTVALGLFAMVMVGRAKASMSLAVRTSTLATFGPVALKMVSKRAGMFGAIAAVATGFLIARNRSSSSS